MSTQKAIMRQGHSLKAEPTSKAALVSAQGDDDQLAASEVKMPYAVGYGRPPQHSQFKKGQSGNPRGRPQGIRNLHLAMQKVLTDDILVHVGGKNRRVPAVIALQRVMLQRGLKGDHRAAATVLRTAKEFGMLEQDEQHESAKGDFVARRLGERINRKVLDEVLRVHREAEEDYEKGMR